MKNIAIEYKNIGDLKMYEKNPRKNDKAVECVANSIKEFGFKNPCIIDRDNVLICGHTRYKAAKRLGIEKVPCITADDLSEEQIKAFRLADNKVAELADWDFELLDNELNEILDIDMTDFGFKFDLETEDDKYSLKVNIPQYEITGECPELCEMLNTEKADELIAEIDEANIPDDIKEFLRYAAYRHNVFNYRNIAEYYAHAEPEVQELFEKSALVIIDIRNAIANGYAKLRDEIFDLMEDPDAE